MSHEIPKKNLILGVIAVLLLGAAGYLIFGRSDGPPADQAAKSQQQADAVSKAMEASGAKTAPAPEIQHPATRGAVGKSGTR